MIIPGLYKSRGEAGNENQTPLDTTVSRGVWAIIQPLQAEAANAKTLDATGETSGDLLELFFVQFRSGW